MSFRNRQQLTERQLELLALYASGNSLHEIGKIKFLSFHTVRHNLHYAKKAAGANTLTHLVAIAVGQGLLVQQQDDSFVPASAAA